MTNFNIVTELIIVEEFARTHQLISSEKMLSDRFDKTVAHAVYNKNGEAIKKEMDDAFKTYARLLCFGGELHETQYNAYCYIGKYSEQ